MSSGNEIEEINFQPQKYVLLKIRGGRISALKAY
jgi:hypothetical protein